MSLTPDRRDHFRNLTNDPRYAHGTNLNPVPIKVGTLRELLDDADEVAVLRAAVEGALQLREIDHTPDATPAQRGYILGYNQAVERAVNTICQHLGGNQ